MIELVNGYSLLHDLPIKEIEVLLALQRFSFFESFALQHLKHHCHYALLHFAHSRETQLVDQKAYGSAVNYER